MTHCHITLLFSQTYGKSWPGFHQYIYKTTNSIYGSSGCSQLKWTNISLQHPLFPEPALCYMCHHRPFYFCALPQPPPLPLLGTTSPPTLTEVRAAEVGAARGGEEEKGPKGKELCLKRTRACNLI